MLLGSHERAGSGNELNLLPALPAAWDEGSVEGLRARGGFEVGMGWTDGRLASAVVRSDHGERCRVRTHDSTVESVVHGDGTAVEFERPERGSDPSDANGTAGSETSVVAFDTDPGGRYRLAVRRPTDGAVDGAVS